MRLELAQAIAVRLIARFADSDQGFIAGSVRRRKPEPRDIELILPHYPTDDDPVYRRVAAMCEVSGDLFDTDAREEPSWFKVERGLWPGFRHAQLLCLASSDDRWHRTGARTGHPVPDFKVDVFRFDLPDAPGTPGGAIWDGSCCSEPAPPDFQKPA